MPSISASVGSRGRNRRADVKIVQRLLNQWQDDIRLDRPLLVDGLVGRKTVLAIVEFQGRVVGLTSPDGRVDPDGATLRVLNQKLAKFTMLARAGQGYYTYGQDQKRFGSRSCLASIKRVAKAMDSMGLIIGVGNISLVNGGRMRPHTSHQRGVDVDFRPLRHDQRRLGTNIHRAEYSSQNTEKLVRELRNDPNLELILFNDDSIPGVKFWTGHDNHLHVRFNK